MKKYSLFVLLFCSMSYAQTPIQVSPIGIDTNNIFSKYQIDRMKIFDTSRLNNLDLTMQSKKIPGLSVQHKSLSATTNLSQAQEYENRFNFGYNFSKSSTISVNAVNQKLYGNLQEDNFFALGFTKRTSSVDINFQLHQLDTSKYKMNGQDPTIANLKAVIKL